MMKNISSQCKNFVCATVSLQQETVKFVCVVLTKPPHRNPWYIKGENNTQNFICWEEKAARIFKDRKLYQTPQHPFQYAAWRSHLVARISKTLSQQWQMFLTSIRIPRKLDWYVVQVNGCLVIGSASLKRIVLGQWWWGLNTCWKIMTHNVESFMS